MSGICEGRVVIITGAGGGLGREYALAFAAEGASIVVNDINALSAETTVDEIVSAGGKALANTSDITCYKDSLNIVKSAIEAFGGLHVVVNNAGVCRDRMFASMTEEEWDQVISVHMKGHFCISSHAVHYWRAQAKEDVEVNARIINTSSGAGLNGSIGQSNYAAAKGGIASLTLNQAAELGRYGITANALAPAGRTGMTAGVFDDMMKKPEEGGFDYYDPANVAPLVVWLGSGESGHITGRVFEAEGGKISIADGWRSTKPVDKCEKWAPSEIGGAIEELVAREKPAQKVYGT
jgi:NAD(P)-dependent dehydrogenase (short-subunit alcohol dehydrogenase family)